MNVSDVQLLLAEAKVYSSAIDGLAGPETWAAIEAVERRYARHYPTLSARWSRRRRMVAAAQAVLLVHGFEPGRVDGYAGHNTAEALIAWRSRKAGVSSAVHRAILPNFRTHASQLEYPRQRDMRSFYGEPGGPQCTAGKVDLPFPMVIAWNRSQRIRRFSCHEKVAGPMTQIFRQTLAHYGQADIERLELNIYGGCFNFRNMRGSDELSTHAYGIATDLNPQRNQLRWGSDRAQFARPEYVPFWNIVIAHGATPAGYAWGKDWMHFQFARL